ncbi:MAG: hypothetical protein V1854_02695, partial [Methanobacteriota archaeon]
MVKRIWMVQQKPFGYTSLRAGLGLITERDMREYGIFYGSEVKDAILKMHQRSCPSLTDFEYNPEMLCPKIYTTRTRRLSGEYVVVEGSRFKAKPVVPEIRFQVNYTWELSLKHGLIYPWHTMIAGSVWGGTNILNKDGLTFSELDLGYRGATFEMLRDELLRLNKKATI